MGWLPWEQGVAIGVALVVAMFLTRGREHGRWPQFRSFCAEASIIAFLYALWVLAGRLSVLQVDGAIERGAQLWEFERSIGLPNEKVWQDALRPHSKLTQAANLYYASAHVAGMGVFLVWLFFWHKGVLPVWRNTLALLTGSCLVIQLIPVAPPRLVDSLGVVDTGLEYGQSVYGTLGYTIAGQLQAMPSIHVAWAALIGWGMWKEGTSVWRWVGPVHAVATMYVVAVTGNHYWVDGIVAIILMVVLYPLASRLATWSSKISAAQRQRVDGPKETLTVASSNVSHDDKSEVGVSSP